MCIRDSPNFYSSFPWLADLFNPDTCVGETITVYRSSEFTGYKYVVLQGPGAVWTELYFQDGTLFCQSTPERDCIAEFALVEAEHTWVCPSSSFDNNSTSNKITDIVNSSSKVSANKKARVPINSSISIGEDHLNNATHLQKEAIHDFTLFPNPTSGNSSIKIANTSQALLIQVRSITGNVIQEIAISANSGEQVMPLDLKGVQAGIYIVQVHQETGILTKRLVVH